jgi:5'-deoxynucleotidase YfbR-like HD superfamily hydrolase
MKYEELVLFHKIGELKKIKRSGWVRCNIPDPESVADHSYRTAFMAMMLGDILKVDTLKLMKMALIHDLGEVMAGDITPYDGIEREEKRRKEEEGLRQLLEGVPNGNEYMGLWKEYEEQKSKEAIILKNIDKLEMAVQALEYQEVFPHEDLSEFILEAQRGINIPEMRDLLGELRRESQNQ